MKRNALFRIVLWGIVLLVLLVLLLLRLRAVDQFGIEHFTGSDDGLTAVRAGTAVIRDGRMAVRAVHGVSSLSLKSEKYCF